MSHWGVTPTPFLAVGGRMSGGVGSKISNCDKNVISIPIDFQFGMWYLGMSVLLYAKNDEIWFSHFRLPWQQSSLMINKCKFSDFKKV